jgi:hypothetical protein
MVTERNHRERRPRIGIRDIRDITVSGAPVKRGGPHVNLTCRFPEQTLLDITRLADAMDTSKNAVILWILSQTDLAGLADRAEEHGGGGTFLVDDPTPPAPTGIEESMRWVESMILRVLRAHQDHILERYRERT